MNAKAAIRRTAAGIAAAFISAAAVLTPLPEYSSPPLTAEAAKLFEENGFIIDYQTITISGAIIDEYEYDDNDPSNERLKLHKDNTHTVSLNGLHNFIITGSTTFPKNCKRLFYDLGDMETISFNEGIDTSEVINMREMFYNCTNLEVVDMSSIVEVENLKDYKNMFKTCSKLKTLSISNEFLDHCVKQSGKTIDSVLETMAIKDTGTAQLKTNLVNQYNEYLKTPITDCTITAPDKDYDGNPPSITVTSGDTVLEENTDYTVTFKQGDTVIDPPVDPGTYECTITGKGNYRGSTTLEFTISPKNTGASLLKKNTVSFKDSISLNFLAEIDDDKADGAYVKFTYDHYGQTKVKNVSLRRDDKNGKYFRFRCPLTASEMTVDVTAELFLASSGSPVDTWTRNIRDYCLTGLDQSSNDLEKTLFRAALNYGGYTQEYFKHNKGTIANTGITDDMTDVTVSSGITSAYPTGVHNGIRYIGSSLLLRDAPYVRYYFEPDTGSDIGDYTFTLRQNGSDTTPNVAHNKDGYYIESVSELAYQLDNAQTVTVTKGEDEVFSFDYSVIKWAESASADTDADDEELNMARALYRYYIAAKAFVDSNKT